MDANETTLTLFTTRLRQLILEHKNLKMAKMLEITNQDMDSARKRLAKLIRDVNKCITLLSEKNLENG